MTRPIASAGLLVVASETTLQVVDRRRLACIGSLASGLVSATTIESVADGTVNSLQAGDEITAVEINLIVGETVVRIASVGPVLSDAGDRARIREAATAAEPVVLDTDWLPGLPARRVAFGIDHPDLQTVIVVGLNAHCAFDEEYQRFVRVVRQTIAASMTAALLRSAELGALRHISNTLQHAMLDVASDLPTVAARYLPKASNLTVGGDWYEVLDLGEGRRALIVGDCVGHGLEAATAMGALRNVSRALLSEGRSPADVITSLHGFAQTMPAAFCATVVCAIVDLPAKTITYANAGHPPPLLVGEKGVWLDQALATPLAVGDPVRTEARVDVEPGDLLVMYTDGLVERPGETIDTGLDRLAECVLRIAAGSVQDIADQLIRELVPETQLDDIALVVKRVH